MQKLTDWRSENLPRKTGWFKFVLLLALAGGMISAGWAQPANDNFANAVPLTTSTGTTNGSNVGASLEACEPTFINGDDFADVDQSIWYSWTATASGTAEFDTFGCNFDSVLAVYTTTNGTMCGATYLTGNDDSANAPGSNPYASQVTFPVVAGKTYYISVDGNAFPATTDSGTVVLNWTGPSGAGGPPANDYFTNATSIVGVSGSVSGSNVGATNENCEPSYLNTDDFVTLTNSVWFAWTAVYNGTAEFDTFGSAFDTVLAVYTTPNNLCSAKLKLIAGNDNAANAPATNQTASQVYFPVTAGTTYYISVDGNGTTTTNSGNYVLNWTSTNSGVTSISTLASGTFSWSTGTYYVADTDGNAPLPQDGATVNPSIEGAVVTISRTGGDNGRVTVYYNTAAGLYETVSTTNTLVTNYWEISITTNGVETYDTNYTLINYTNAYQYFYNGAYQWLYQPGSITNSATNAYPALVVPAVTNVYVLVNKTGTGRYPANVPPLNLTSATNITTTSGVAATDNATYTNLYTTNLFVAPSSQANYTGVNYINTYSTNTYGSDISLTTLTNTGIFNTNYLLTEVAFSNYYSLSNVVVDGVITNYYVIASNIVFVPVTSSNSDNSTYTNLFYTYVGTTTMSVTNYVPSATNTDFTAASGSVTFDNYQTFANITLPVGLGGVGPDAQAPGLNPLFNLTINGVALDPEESQELAAPKIGTANAQVSVLSDQFVPGESAPGTNNGFDFERSTFRVNKDVVGGVAIISVDRGVQGGYTGPCTVDYETVDPFSPVIFYNPYNTFTLEAGSDYAMPNSDYTPVNGTLSWGQDDFQPKQIMIPILDNGLVEPNVDILVRLYNPQSPMNVGLGTIYEAHVTELFNNTTAGPGASPVAGQQPAGAVDRSWNQDNVSGNGLPGSDHPFLNYPGTSGGNGGQVYAAAQQADGKSVIAGSFVSYDSDPYNNIVRTLVDGEPDSSFMAPPNSGANDYISSLGIQPDGRIVIGGNFTSFNGVNRYHVARLNTDGSVDTNFNPGLGANGMVWSVAVQTNGQIVIGGAFTSYNGTNVNEVARLNADGSLDTSFNPGPIDGLVDAVTVDSLGRVLIGGDFNNVWNVNEGGVARLNVDGSLDTTFNSGVGTYNTITGTADKVNCITLQANGQILIGGAFSAYQLAGYNGILRLNPDGTVDPSFNPGLGTYNLYTTDNDVVYAITMQPDGNILVGGDFQFFNMTRRDGLTRLFTDGSVDTSFMDTAYNEFAGIPNHYFNENAVNTALYPVVNKRNLVYTVEIEFDGNVIIGGSFDRVGGGYTTADIHNRSNVAQLIGGSTPGPGNIGFLYSKYSVDNTAGNLFVSLTRTNGSLGIASVDFDTNTPIAGLGVAGPNDLSVSGTTPTWPNIYSFGAVNSPTVYPGTYGPNFQTIPTGIADSSPYTYVNVFNDTNSPGDLSAQMALTYPAGHISLGGEYIVLGTGLGSQATVPLTIIDNNTHPGTLSFSAPSYFVNENGTNALITVVRTGGSDGIVQVSYATGNGTATTPTNYTAVTGTLTFLGGVTSNSFTIPIINGTTLTADKTVSLSLYNAVGGANLGLNTAVLTIINSVYTPGQVNFTQTTFGTNENSKVAYFTINRLGGNTGQLIVTNSVTAGTAVNGVNFTGSTNVLTWVNNDSSSRTIAVPVFQDGVVTSNLTVNLSLYGASVNGKINPNALGIYTNATLIVTNIDSYGLVEFSSPTYGVKKYAGTALIPVNRVGGVAQTVTVNYSTADASAVAGVNYVATSGTLTFTNGQVSQFISVPVIDDGISDGSLPLYFKVNLSGATPAGVIGTPGTAQVFIIDTESVNEPPGSPDATFASSAGFNSNVYSVAIDLGNQLLVGGDFTYANGVPRQHLARLNNDGTLDSTFLEPLSTSGANGSVRALAATSDGRILAGGLFTTFDSVAMNHIAVLNADGTLNSTFNPGSGADNPVYAIAETFVGGQSEILAAGAFATFNGQSYNGIVRLFSDGTPDPLFNPGLGANATVYAMAVQSDGRIVIGGDFTAVNGNTNFNHIGRLNADGTVDATFNPGLGAGDSVRAVAVQPDGKILIGGLFTNVNGIAYNHIARLNTDGSLDTTFQPGVGANSSVLTIGLQTDGRIVVGGEFTLFSGVTRNRITRLNPNGTVDPTINFGAGANDFVAALLVQEDTIEGYPTNVPDEKIVIGGQFTSYDGLPFNHLERIYGGSVSGSGSFQFTSPVYQVDERGTNIIITVQRMGGTSGTNTDLSGDIYVPFATSDGSALAGVNYTAVITNLDFVEGEVFQEVVIPVFDDGVVTTNLTANLSLGNPFTAGEVGNQPTAVLTIINDDSAIDFSSAVYSVPKNIVSGVAAINVLRQGATYGTSTAFFTTTTGTAAAGTDYTPVSGILTFAPGVSNVVVTVPINNNGIAEGNKTLGLQLSNITGSIPIAPTNATLTIIDTVNAPGSFAFTATNYTVTEGGGLGYSTVLVTVVRTNGTYGDVSVAYATSDGTAISGFKYIPTNGVLDFADGESTASFLVSVVNTTTAEGPEFFNVGLSVATGGASLVFPTNATVTILNTNTGIAFALATNTVNEPSGANGGNVTLNVVRYNNTTGTNVVYYSTADGTAVAGTNYVGVTNGAVTFNPGDSVKQINIGTLEDLNPLVNIAGQWYLPSSWQFTVSLALPTNSNAQLTPPSKETVVINDLDVGVGFYNSFLLASLGVSTNVYKNQGDAIVVVYTLNTNQGPVSVAYTESDGSAVAGLDYTRTSGTLALTNSASIVPGLWNFFTIPILPNNQVHTNRTFTVTLSVPSGGPSTELVIPPKSEVFTILNTNTPYGLSFSSPVNLTGDWGSTNVSNLQSVPEPNDPIVAGYGPFAPVWFKWVAPADGEVTLDTIGSVTTNGLKMGTVLGVYTGSALANLNQIAVNANLFPYQENQMAEPIYNTGVSSTNAPDLGFIDTAYLQPYSGPSGLRFNAQAGVTYYFEVDGKFGIGSIGQNGNNIVTTSPGQGLIQLNWAYHSSGVFRFASEMVDQTGLTDTNGNPLLLYQCADTESVQPLSLLGPGNYNANDEDTMFANTYYSPNVAGLLVTITRVAGSSGRVSVDYRTVDGVASMITNGDIPAIAGTDYQAVQGTLIFDDFEMSKQIYIPIYNGRSGSIVNGSFAAGGNPNRDFTVVLSNPQRDPQESPDVSAPRVDSIFGQVDCRILDTSIDPREPNFVSLVQTNPITGLPQTNVFSSLPTNSVFNFTKAEYRIPRDEIRWFGTNSSQLVTLYVVRSGTNQNSETVHWRINNDYLATTGPEDADNEFPLQPGSDYAVPTPASVAAIHGTNSDFAGSGGDSGTLTFGSKKSQLNQGQSQAIQFTLNNNNLPAFNRDIHVQIYEEDSNGNPLRVGMNDQTTVTILFNDAVPPAGSVDELWNPDFASALAYPTNFGYLGSSVVTPGTELFHEVYSLVVLPTNSVEAGNQTLIAGAFQSYQDGNNTYQANGIARLNYDGSLDTTFNPASGVNVFPGGEFIRVVQLAVNSPTNILIGGDFSSFDGAPLHSIARLNWDGSVDTTFNPGSGVNGTVWGMAQQPDGRIIIVGDFTTYNGNPARNAARVNTDGSLDNTFNVGTNLNGTVFTVGLQPNGSILLGGAFTSVGGLGGQNRIVRLNSDGSLDTSFNTITGPNAPVHTLVVQPDGKVVAGGEFTIVAGQADNRIVRFNGDGSLDSTFNAGSGADGTIFSINDEVSTNLDGSTNSVFYVGGAFTTFNGTHRAGFTRLYADGSVDTTFLDTAYNQFAGLPRIFYKDAPGTVYASGVQDDGNIMIAGSFEEVGGGQANQNCRNYLEQELGLTPSMSDPNLLVSESGTSIEPKSRDGVRVRSNVARLIGGSTAGPGNIGFAASSYAVNKSQATESVTLVRTNGSLGYAVANFSIAQGLATSGMDYSNAVPPPTYPLEWEYNNVSRDHYDGLFGPNGQMNDKYGGLERFGVNSPAAINVGIINDTSMAGNLDATMQLANPADVDQFYLGGEDIPVGVALGESSAPFTLVDNAHQDGTFGFVSPDFVATNSVATLMVVRTNSVTGTVQLSYQTVTNGSTAVAGVDYAPTNGTLLFNPGQGFGQTSNSFPIVILENSYSANTEKQVNVQLLNLQDLSSGAATLGVTNAVLRIINPNFQGYLSLSTNYYTTNLGAGYINFVVTRTVGSKGTLSVQYATTNGNAYSGVNYVGSTNTLTWNSGDVSPRVVSIQLLNNNIVGGPGAWQFGVALSNPILNNVATAGLFSTNSVTFATLNVVNDNSAGAFQFSASQYLVNDDGGYATITVTRTGSALGAAKVYYTTADATATAGANYVPASGYLAFAQGQLSTNFNVTILPDTQPEPPPASFYFNVLLTGTTAGTLGTPTNATVNIVDSQTFNQPPGAIDTSFNPSLIVNGSVLSLGLQSDGQIIAGGVFTAINGANLNHVARLNTDGSLDTSFLYGLAGANGSVNTLAVQTDDRILLGGSFSSVNGTVRNNIARLQSDGTLDTSFYPGSGADNSVFALAETFINGSRYDYVGGGFSTFNGIASPGIVRLDNFGDVDAGFATGAGANGTVYAIAAYPTNSVYNDGSVLVGGGFTNFNGQAAANIVRLNENGSVDTTFAPVVNGTVRAIVIQTDGSILIGGDFTMVNSVPANHLARLIFNNGNGAVSVDTVFAANLNGGFNGTVDSILVQPDDRILVAGQFNLANGLNRNNITRLNPDGTMDPTINFGVGANGAINSLVLQPTNDFILVGGAFTEFEGQPLDYIARLYGGSITGAGQFTFSSPNYQVDENGGFATITVIRSGGSSTNAGVNFTTTTGTAIPYTNYIPRTTNLVFVAGQTFQTVTIPVLNDGNVDPNLTVGLSLSSPTNGAGLGDQSTAVLTIVDDNAGLSFASASYSVPKDTITGVANIILQRVGSTVGSCTVDFQTDTNGTAVIGVDYYATNEVVTFNPGDSQATVQVPVINNTIPEGNKTVGMLLTNATGVTLASPTNATLTIVDTVNAPGQLSFDTNNYWVVKSNDTIYLNVVRTNGSSGSVQVNYNTVAGTATPGLNYVTSRGTLTLGDGVTVATIPITLVDNSLIQGTVNFSVNLSNPQGGATLINPTNTVVNILDHNVGVAFQNATNYVIETAGSAVVFVQRVGATNSAFTVSYNTTPITAVPGTNYITTSGTLSFATNEILKSVSIPVLYDPQVTGDLLFGINLTTNAESGAQLAYPSNALVVIHDADAGLSFTNSAMSVLKSSGVATITVVCSNPSVEPVIVNSNTVPLEVSYFTTNGTAVAGSDYVAVSGTMVFTNGNGTNTFTVPILNSAALTGNRTFNVVLANPTAPGQLTPPSTQTVTIVDVNSGVEFSSPTYTINQNNLAATINVYRSGYLATNVLVNYTTLNGTASSNVNYVPVSGALVFTNGVTNLSFSVPIISSTVVQPDLNLFLELSGALNASLLYPSFATLTIQDTSGGSVVPAGAVMVEPEGFAPPNGIIDPGETDTVRFGFRVNNSVTASNVVATLLATNGVTPVLNGNPQSSVSQSYGTLVGHGPTVSEPFTLTASGTNGQTIIATFKVSSVANSVTNTGIDTFTFNLGTWTASYSNSTPIIINDLSPASPYPSVISIASLPGVVLKATVTLTNVDHTSPGDIEALVVAPNQQNTLIMANDGAGNVIKNVTLTFDGSVTNKLPEFNQIVSGTNQPTSYPTINPFP